MLRISRDQLTYAFDASTPPVATLRPGETVVVETYDTSTGRIRKRERARGELAGVIWQGQELRGSTMLPPADRHFIKHVMLRREWPDNTALDDYLASIQEVVHDPASGVATRRYEGRAWQLTVVRRSGSLRGPAGHEWVLVDYRVETGHWTTAYQFSEDPTTELRRKAEEFRWLRRPRA
ncbi:MAG TPA: hypothetical protein VIL01_04215 [Thermomicrobiales bacterium]